MRMTRGAFPSVLAALLACAGCGPAERIDPLHSASWVLDDLTATTSSFGLSTCEEALRYTGFAGRRWDLSLTGDAAGPVGDLVIDDESVRCSVRGTWESPSISCL